MVAADDVKRDLIDQRGEALDGVHHQPAQDPRLLGDGLLGQDHVAAALGLIAFDAVTGHGDLDTGDA